MTDESDNAGNSSNGQKHAEPFVERRGARKEPPSEFLAQQVEAAILPLLPYLTARQAELVRSTVQASIEGDPVSRRLLANAVQSSDRSTR